MSCKRALSFIAVATAFEGLRAGIGLLRLVLDLPARGLLGASAYADFFRATDLTSRGFALYLTYGFGGAVMTALAYAAARRAGLPTAARRLIATSVVASIAILVMTTQAVPLGLSVRTETNPVALNQIFNRFELWTVLRLCCGIASFLCMITALTIVATSATRPQPQ